MDQLFQHLKMLSLLDVDGSLYEKEMKIMKSYDIKFALLHKAFHKDPVLTMRRHIHQ